MKRTLSIILSVVLSLLCFTASNSLTLFAEENHGNEKSEIAIAYKSKYSNVTKEFTNGFYKIDANGKRYYEYNRSFFLTPEDVFTVYYSDGTKTVYTMIEEEVFDESKGKVLRQIFKDSNGNYLPDHCTFTDDQLTNHWKVGTHYFNLEYHGLKCTIPVSITATGWISTNNSWYYYQNGDSLKYLQTINGKRYYFNSKGVMLTGWINGKKWMYADLRSGVLYTGWHKINNKWYLFKYADSTMITGWAKSGNKWYYLNPSGDMAVGWKKVSGKWYYFNSSGDMAVGWKKVSGKWYYFEYSGAMLANTTRRIGSKNYNFNSSGACTNPY